MPQHAAKALVGNWGQPMMVYQLCFFDHDKLVYWGEQECADDDEAKALAKQLSMHFEVEVWRDGQLLTRLKRDGGTPKA